jgi:ribose transport system permease protein
MTALSLLRAYRWSWAALGVLVLWGALSLITRQFGLSSLSGVMVSASFLFIVATAQMFAVSTGGGNVDLSIPSVITISAFVTAIAVGGSDLRLLIGVPLVVLLGAAIGAVNAVLILRLRIPAIIATLAVGYVLATATLLANRIFASYGVSPILRAIATGKILGVPCILITAAALLGVAELVIGRTVYGRALMAVGQNARGAELAGARVWKVTTAAFMISSVLAALDGALLFAYSGGAFLEMGSPYLLQSIGAVVLGGTLIFGGSATPRGCWFGSVLLVLIVTTMQVAHLAGGTQDIVQGVVIIAVLAVAGAGAAPRRGRA